MTNVQLIFLFCGFVFGFGFYLLVDVFSEVGCFFAQKNRERREKRKAEKEKTDEK